MTGNNNKKKYIMISSVPMSLDEVALAPAIIGALIKNRGHDFEFFDINLNLYQRCIDIDDYHEKTECLSDWFFDINSDFIAKEWLKNTIDKIKKFDSLIVNVFSVQSQRIASTICELLKDTGIEIYVGGVGSHLILNNNTSRNTLLLELLSTTFKDTSDLTFGKLLCNNNLATHWQPNISTSVLEKNVPDLGTSSREVEFDFTVYNLDQYLGKEKALPLLGSYGCVRACEFCDVLKHFGKFRFIEADKLTKSIVTAYNDTGISQFTFMDSLVNGSVSNFENLLKNLIHSKQQGWLPNDFSWSGTYICRQPSLMLDRIHELLPQSGVSTLTIGMECASDKVRFDMQKKVKNHDFINEFESFSKTGVKALLLFFVGFPTETTEDFNETFTLFQKLAKYGQTGTIESITYGAHGFAYIDGTPIALRKDEIQLEPGPIRPLWRCHTNPSLDLYEMIRRRHLAIEIAKFYGINTYIDGKFRRTIASQLKVDKDLILEYVGPLKNDILTFDKELNSLPNTHSLNFEVSNKGIDSINVLFKEKNKNKTFTCNPGTTKIVWTLDKPYYEQYDLDIVVRFPESYCPDIQRYPTGDYYSSNGVYVSEVKVDYKDITLNGFDQLSDCAIDSDVTLPEDYFEIVNKRNLIHNTTFSWRIPEKKGLHTYIWEVSNPEFARDDYYIDKKLAKVLESFKLTTNS